MDIVNDVIIPIAVILKIFFYHFFVTLQSMTVPNFMSKAFSYQDLGSGRTMCPPWCMIRQKYPGSDRVNKVAKRDSGTGVFL